MQKIANTQEVRKITMYPVAQTKCVIGGDWYTNSLMIHFCPRDSYPDYTEVQSWIMENIDGKALNIEDVVDMIHTMMSSFKPSYLLVRDRVENCKTHFNVIVEK